MGSKTQNQTALTFIVWTNKCFPPKYIILGSTENKVIQVWSDMKASALRESSFSGELFF